MLLGCAVAVRSISETMSTWLYDISYQNNVIYRYNYTFKVYKSVHHHTIQINQPTRYKNLSCLLFDVYL